MTALGALFVLGGLLRLATNDEVVQTALPDVPPDGGALAAGLVPR